MMFGHLKKTSLFLLSFTLTSACFDDGEDESEMDEKRPRPYEQQAPMGPPTREEHRRCLLSVLPCLVVGDCLA